MGQLVRQVALVLGGAALVADRVAVLGGERGGASANASSDGGRPTQRLLGARASARRSG